MNAIIISTEISKKADITVVDTLAQSHVSLTKSTAGTAEDKAEDFKSNNILVWRNVFISTH